MKKSVELEYGDGVVRLDIPESAAVLGAGGVSPLGRPREAIEASLREPIGTASLAQLAAGRGSAAIVVSDNTRPVPYRGEQGILRPILEVLREASVAQIKVIVATGTHRPMTDAELRAMLDEGAFEPPVELIQHVCTDEDVLRVIGSTPNTPDVKVNRHYLDAELKILTGLVEPHFMAGYSGGRKGVCPGICGEAVTYGFHSAKMLDDPKSADLELAGNPCHEESLQIATMAGVDFIVNVTLDSAKQVTGVFSGELDQAHKAAVAFLDTYATIPIGEPYDIALIHSGHVGMNHYQCAKAAMEGCHAVRRGGHVIMLASLTDHDPLGSPNYKLVMKQLSCDGAAGFRERILNDANWQFVPEQWQPQMWAKIFDHLGDVNHLHTCATQLADTEEGLLLEENVARHCRRGVGEEDAAWAGRMVQETLDGLLRAEPKARVAVLVDGPYSVPCCESGG